jgi:hypothetical protein
MAIAATAPLRSVTPSRTPRGSARAEFLVNIIVSMSQKVPALVCAVEPAVTGGAGISR